MSASAKSSCVDVHWFTQRIHHARVDTLANVLPPIPLHGRVLQDIRSEGSTVTSKLHELADNPHGVVKGASSTAPLLVVAGWECQDLSPAGSGAGLEGRHCAVPH